MSGQRIFPLLCGVLLPVWMEQRMPPVFGGQIAVDRLGVLLSMHVSDARVVSAAFVSGWAR